MAKLTYMRPVLENAVTSSELSRGTRKAIWWALVTIDDLTARLTQKPCKWSHDDTHDKWDTSCGEAWQFNDGDLSENRLVYCPFCGGRVAEAAEAAKGGE